MLCFFKNYCKKAYSKKKKIVSHLVKKFSNKVVLNCFMALKEFETVEKDYKQVAQKLKTKLI